MSSKRQIEIFSAGCAACDETVAMVKRIACSSCDGRLAACCTANGPDEASLRAAGVGVPLP